jgi:hypothetical protein
MSNPIDFTELSYEIPASKITHQKKKIIQNSCLTDCKCGKCRRLHGRLTSDDLEECKNIVFQLDDYRHRQKK